MLKLIRCEFWKLRRKKFVLLVVLSAFLFPIPLTLMMTTPQILARYDSKAEVFDGLFSFTMGYGAELLLPCVIGVVAAMLFFMERDHETFKSLRTIPVTSTQMVLAKIIVLFLFSILFSLVSTVVLTVCGGIVLGGVNGLGYKLLMAVEMGIFMTAGTLPLVVLVVFFSKTYIFSILLCVFYSVLSLTVECMFTDMPRFLCWAMPIPLITLWSAGDMAQHGFLLNLNEVAEIIPSTLQTVAILGVMAVLSILLIDWLYKRRDER